MLGSPAYDIDNEIAKLSKELDILDQEEGSERPSHEALVGRLDRMMSIRDELESDAQISSGPGSTSHAPIQGDRLELFIPGLDFDLQEGEGELLHGNLVAGFCKNTIFLVMVNHL